jgi:hypothetical protein
VVPRAAFRNRAWFPSFSSLNRPYDVGVLVVIAVAVRRDDVLDARRVEADVARPTLDELGCFFARVQCLEQNDSVSRIDRPGADLGITQEIEIVEGNQRRLGRLGKR